MTDIYQNLYGVPGMPTEGYDPDHDPYKGLDEDERMGIALKQVASYLAGLLAVLLLCALFGSCATQKQMHEQHVRNIVADMLAEQATQDTHVSNTTVDIDSLVRTLTQQYTDECLSHEDERETTTETITTAIDSLGRQLRTEQRTTTRTLSRDEQQRQQMWRQQMEQAWQRRFDRQDSLYSALESRVAGHWADSTAQQRDKAASTDAAKALTWWQRAWSWLRGVLIGIVIALVVMAARGWLKILKK